METKVHELSASENELEVTLQYDEIKSELEEAYKEERKKISLPGFRKGKAPLQMLKKIYGDAIEYQASEKIANKKFWDIVESEGLKPISTPQLTDIDFQVNEKLYFKVKYEIKPVLEVKEYTSQEVEKPVFKLREEDIEKEIDALLKSKATYETADEVSEENCRITLDLQKLDDEGKYVEGSRSENMLVDLSDPKVNPDIKTNSLNKKVNDTFNFTFVDEHMHGEEVHKETYNYECNITKIEKIVMPEITEKLVEEISSKKAKTIDELKQQLRDNFKKYYDEQSDRIYTNSLLNKIVENNNFDPPKGYVEILLKRFVEMERENSKKYKSPFNENQAKTQLQGRAEWNAKWEIVMESIAAKENLTVGEDELEKLAEVESKQTGISVDKLIKFYKDTKKDDGLLEEKVIEFLKEKNIAKEFDPDDKKNEEPKEKKPKGKKK